MSSALGIGISVFLQAAAILTALAMLRFTKSSPGWFALLALLGLQLFRRSFDLIAALRIGPAWLQRLDSAWLSVPLSLVVFLAMVFMLLDLRRRSNNEAKLQEAEGRYGELFEHNQAPMVLMSPEGPDHAAIHDVNEAAARYYGYTRAEMRGMSMTEICPVPMEEIMAQVQRVRSGEDDRYHFRHRLASGELRDVEIFSGVITLEGRPLVYQIIADVTEGVNAQRALAERNRTLEAAVHERTGALEKTVQDLESALAARGQFLAGMSHELRTPLNSIIGYSGVMLSGMAGDLSAEQRKQLDMVSRSARHLLTLINDVLDVAQLDHGAVHVDARDFSANELVDEVTSMMAPLVAEEGLELIVVPALEDVTVCNDITKVEQILINLLGNAVKFTQVGTVGVTVDVRKDDRVDFVVTDTGVGIPGQWLPRVTEPFVQVRHHDGMKPAGVGLGLSISSRLAEALGGELTVLSEPGVGSTVVLSIPRAYVAPVAADGAVLAEVDGSLASA